MKNMYRERGYDKFEFVIVSDLENVGSIWLFQLIKQDNAFDEAVVGVECAA